MVHSKNTKDTNVDKTSKQKKQRNHIVKESNALARAKVKPAISSVWDMRVITTVAARNTVCDEVFREHTIDLRAFNGGKELSTLQFSELKDAISRLGHATYEIRTKERIQTYPIFFSLEATRQKITARFNEALRPYYLRLREYFTMLCISDFQKLTSIYSQRLYEILCSWRYEREKVISLEELYSMLNVPTALQQYSNFRRRVLNVAHKEINAVAENSASDNPLEYEWEAVKEGQRKVVAIRFILNVRERKNQQMIEETRKMIRGLSGLGLFLPPEQEKGGNCQ